MTKIIGFSIFLIVISFNMNAQEWKTPVINGYGRIAEFDEVAIKPDKSKEYKVIFNITSEKEREEVNNSLWKMARLINLLENEGVPAENIKIVGVISGPASPISLSDEAHLKRHQKKNPNLDLMKKLSDHGVQIHLCGQAAAERKIDPKSELNPYTKLTLSALTDVLHYQMAGYLVMF